MRIVPAGQLRQRVTLMAPPATETYDTFGQPNSSPVTVGTFWAWIRPLQGREAILAKQVKAEATHMITMRWLGSITLTPLNWLLFNGRYFGIVQVLNVEERNIQYEIIAQEIQQTTAV